MPMEKSKCIDIDLVTKNTKDENEKNEDDWKQNNQDERKSQVSADLLQRFKAISKRTDEVTKRSREKRIRYLQKSIKEKVDKEITEPEDRDILRKYDVKFGPPIENKGQPQDDRESEQESNPKELQQINEYLGINDHLKGIDRGNAAPKTGLEKKIDKAIELGEFDTAEHLSDRLATREFGKRVADAFTAKDFIEKKKFKESSERKKKKLNWGFEQKHRWETKSNM